MGTGLIATTTSTKEEQYGIGARGEGLLRGVGGEGEPSVDVTYSTKDDGIPLGNGRLTTTVTTIEIIKPITQNIIQSILQREIQPILHSK